LNLLFSDMTVGHTHSKPSSHNGGGINYNELEERREEEVGIKVWKKKKTLNKTLNVHIWVVVRT